jgi:replicative DNA helicase
MRWACNLSGLSVREVRRGLDGDALARFSKAQAEIAEWNIEIIEGVKPLPQVRAEAVGRARASGLDLVVVDNIELATRDARGMKEYERLRNGAYDLLDIANAAHAPLFVTIQIGVKKLEARPDKRPEMSDIYGGDGPGQAASVVLLLHRQDRWAFGQDKTHDIDIVCWKDKVHHTGIGQRIRCYFGLQGQVKDLVQEEVNLW